MYAGTISKKLLVLNLLSATVFLPRLPASGEGVKIPGIYRVLEHIATKLPMAIYTYVFGVKLSDGGTSGFVGRRRAPEIQDGG